MLLHRKLLKNKDATIYVYDIGLRKTRDEINVRRNK